MRYSKFLKKKIIVITFILMMCLFPSMINAKDIVTSTPAKGLTISNWLVAGGIGGTSTGLENINMYLEKGEKVDITAQKNKMSLVVRGTEGNLVVYDPEGNKVAETDYPELTSGISNTVTTSFTAQSTGVYVFDTITTKAIDSEENSFSLNFKITDSSSTSHKSGKIWSNRIALKQAYLEPLVNGNFNPDELDDIKLYYTTYDGYVYEYAIDKFNGINTFFTSDPVGTIDVSNADNCTSAYASGAMNTASQRNSYSFFVGSPSDVSEKCKNYVRLHNLYFEMPSNDLPDFADVISIDGKTRLPIKDENGEVIKIRKHVFTDINNMTPTFSDVNYVPNANGIGGKLYFNSTNYAAQADVKIKIDRDRDGTYEDEVSIEALVNEGTTTEVVWDGKDSSGKNVGASALLTSEISIRKTGEVHFTITDMEARGGVSTKALNGIGSDYVNNTKLTYDNTKLEIDYDNSPDCNPPLPLSGTYDSYGTAFYHAWKYPIKNGVGVCKTLGSDPTPAQSQSFGDGKVIDEWMYENAAIKYDRDINKPLVVGIKEVKDTTGDDKAQPKENLIYTYKYTNVNNAPAVNTILKDDFADTKFKNAVIESITAKKYDKNNNLVWTKSMTHADVKVGANNNQPYYEIKAGNLGENERVEIETNVKMSTFQAIDELENQGSASADNQNEIFTYSKEDPTTPGIPIFNDPNNPGELKTPDKTIIPTIDTAKIHATKSVVSKRGSTKYIPGDVLNYTLYFYNPYYYTATDVIISDPLTDTEFEGATISNAVATLNGVNVGSGNIKTGFSIGDIKEGEYVKVEFSVTLSESFTSTDDIIKNQASGKPSNGNEAKTHADADTNKPWQPVDITKEPEETTIIKENASLSATKIVSDCTKDGKAEAGEELYYSIYVRNTGNVTVKNAIISDKFSDSEFENMKIVGTRVYKNDSMINYTGDIITGVAVGDIGLSDVIKIELTIQLADPFTNTDKIIKNQGNVSSDNTEDAKTTANVDPKDPSKSLDGPNDKPSETTIPVGNAKLVGTKIVIDENNDNMFSPKEKLEYRIYYRNVGDVVAKNVIIVDPLDDKEFTNSIISKATATKGNLKYSGDIRKGIAVGDVKSNELVSVSFFVTLPAKLVKDDVTPNKLVNQAYATGDNVEKAYTTSNVDPNDPTKPNDSKESNTKTIINLKDDAPVPITGDKTLYVILIILISTLGITTYSLRLRYR